MADTNQTQESNRQDANGNLEMKSDLLKRLFTAIALESQRDLDQIAQTIVASEKEHGHNRLARELERILELSLIHI